MKHVLTYYRTCKKSLPEVDEEELRTHLQNVPCCSRTVTAEPGPWYRKALKQAPMSAAVACEHASAENSVPQERPKQS